MTRRQRRMKNTKQKNSFYVFGAILLTISVVAIVAVIYQEYKLFLILEGSPLALLPAGVIVAAILTTVYISMDYADAFREITQSNDTDFGVFTTDTMLSITTPKEYNK